MKEHHYRPNLNARNLALRREYLVAYVGISSSNRPYFNRDIQLGLKKALRAFEDDGLFLINKTCETENDREYMEIVTELEHNGVKNFILFPKNSPELCEFAQALINRGNTVVLLSNRLNIDGILAYCGSDYYKSGTICAQLVNKICDKGGKVQTVLNHVEESESSTTERYRGFMESLDKNADFKICPPFYLNEHHNSQNELFDFLSESCPTAIIDIIGDLETISRAAVKNEFHSSTIIGFDLYDEVIGYLRDDVIDVLINQDLPYQAWLAVKILFRYLCYDEPPETVENFAVLDIIMSSNLSCFYHK